MRSRRVRYTHHVECLYFRLSQPLHRCVETHPTPLFYRWPRASSINSSCVQFGLIPGQAPLACSSSSALTSRAGRKGHWRQMYRLHRVDPAEVAGQQEDAESRWRPRSGGVRGRRPRHSCGRSLPPTWTAGRPWPQLRGAGRGCRPGRSSSRRIVGS